MGTVDGINEGLAILGKGTFKFCISDDDGKGHRIRIPNSLYLPKLQGCLLSPQHWVQEAGDNETWMGNFAHCCILHWCGGKNLPGLVLRDPCSPLTRKVIYWLKGGEWALLKLLLLTRQAAEHGAVEPRRNELPSFRARRGLSIVPRNSHKPRFLQPTRSECVEKRQTDECRWGYKKPS